MGGRTASLTITADGRIAKVVNHYLIINLWLQEHSEASIIGWRSHCLRVRTTFWKTDHKKVYFLSNEVLERECVNTDMEPIPYDPSIYKIDERLIGLVESIESPVEIKDYYINAVRRYISARLKECFDLSKELWYNPQQKHSSHFVSEEGYLQWKSGGVPEISPADEANAVRRIGDMIVEFDRVDGPETNYTLFDLPLSKWISAPAASAVKGPTGENSTN